MTTGLVMVRHPRVDARYRGVCYGRADVELGDDGRLEADAIAEAMRGWPIRRLVASGATRAGWLADRIAGRPGPGEAVEVEVEVDPALLERDFGAWELRTWDDIYAEVGDALHGMIDRPGTYRPGGGETTFELRDRVVAWYHRHLGHPGSSVGLTVAVTHGGPIAALRGTLAGKGPADWAGLIPPTGAWVAFDREGAEVG